MRRQASENCWKVFLGMVLGGALLTPSQPAFSQTPAAQTPVAQGDRPHAVAFLYHRFGEDAYPTTSVTREQFEAHLEELESGGYTILPLEDITRALRDGTPLPDRAIALTMDDAYESIYSVAFPALKERGFPFTVFVSTEPVDKGFDKIMNWDQIRELAAAGVTIGHHTVSHLHMPRHDLDRAAQEIDEASARFQKELGAVPKLFAYPYGEFSAEHEALIRKAGFDAAFGQHSGVMFGGGNNFTLPRFSMNMRYGDRARFKLAANALPLPVTDVVPVNFVVGKINPPPLGFTLLENIPGLAALACFASHEGKPAQIERLGARRIEVRMAEAMPRGRTRVNCTLPAGQGRWRWYGVQFYVP